MSQSRAYQNLFLELGLEASSIPQANLIHDAFDRLCGGKGLSVEAETAMLYRIVAMQYLAMTAVMARDHKVAPDPNALVLVTTVVDASVAWSERAPDQHRLESIASHLNKSIETSLSSLGVRRGSSSSQSDHRYEASIAVRREVERCARSASRLKIEYRLGQLSGFFDKLKNQGKLLAWGQSIEQEYQRIIDESPQLWDEKLGRRQRTLLSLWDKFGLGQAHSGECIYPNELGAKCISTWLTCLWPDVRFSTSDLLDEIERIGIRNSQAYEAASAEGIRFTFARPIDQLVKDLSQKIGPYA